MTSVQQGPVNKKTKSAKQTDARRRAIRERLSQRSREGHRTGKSVSKHANHIAKYHALEKQIAQADDPNKRAELELEQSQLGGLENYQSASLTGAKFGETSKWLVQTLEALRGRQQTRVLDVGAITGTAYSKYRSFEATYIDLNPQAPHVQKADISEYSPPDIPFDVVCLSLVLNFVGDLSKRTFILRHLHELVKSGGFLYIVLPLACLQNSRYMDTDRFREILKTLGWQTVAQHDSNLLTFWLCKQVEGDLRKWPRKQIRGGVDRNNFVLLVK